MVKAFGSTLDPSLRQIRPDTIKKYLSGLRSYHVDRRWSCAVFDSPHLNRILDGARSVFPHTKPRLNRLPITKDILQKITPQRSFKASLTRTEIDTINVDTAFKTAFGGFLRMGEYTYTAKDIKLPVTFESTKLTRRDVKFSENFDHMTLHLKRSKTDKLHEGVTISIAATHQVDCPVYAMRQLFIKDPQPDNAPLFRFSQGAFSKPRLIKILDGRLRNVGIDPSHYTGHSFRSGAAQHAHDSGLANDLIKILGRWASEAHLRYHTHSRGQLLYISHQFQTGKPLPYTLTPSQTPTPPIGA